MKIAVYLEDSGAVSGGGRPASTLAQARDASRLGGPASQISADQQVDYQAVWQLEMWKRSEEAKFKAYLKQREIEKIEEITAAWKFKESDRENQFIDALKSVDALEAKLRNQALDLQRREERIIQLEEELKHKINEVSRSLVSKEEEVMSVKKRFKEEKQMLETTTKRQATQIEELNARLHEADTKFVAYKQSVEHSPLNVLRTELAQKQIEIVDLESKLAKSNEDRDEFRAKFERVKKDMIQLKKQIDHEKELALTR